MNGDLNEGLRSTSLVPRRLLYQSILYARHPAQSELEESELEDTKHRHVSSLMN